MTPSPPNSTSTRPSRPMRQGNAGRPRRCRRHGGEDGQGLDRRERGEARPRRRARRGRVVGGPARGPDTRGATRGCSPSQDGGRQEAPGAGQEARLGKPVSGRRVGLRREGGSPDPRAGGALPPGWSRSSWRRRSPPVANPRNSRMSRRLWPRSPRSPCPPGSIWARPRMTSCRRCGSGGLRLGRSDPRCKDQARAPDAHDAG